MFAFVPTAATAAPAARADAGLAQKAAQQGSVHVIVTLKTKSDQQPVLNDLANKQHKYKLRVKYTKFPLLALDVDSAALQQLANSPDVAAIQEDSLAKPTLASSVPHINGDKVHVLGYTGSGQAVAILDSGIDENHPFFGSRIVSEACYSNGGNGGVSLCGNGSKTQTGAGSADAMTAQCLNGSAHLCDHGTHVAGIAAGSAAGVTGAPGDGVAPAASIIAIQVFTRFNDAASCDAPDDPAPCVRAYTSDQILGLQRVLTLSSTITIAAVNMSLGGGEKQTTACDSDSLKGPIDNLLSAGIVTAIAAGNDSFPDGVATPGCISTAVTVGSADDSDNLASDTDRGTLVDLFAPGVSVVSSIPDNTWVSYNGTSMATPHVAGSFAVLKAAYPNATPATLLSYLKDTGVSLTYPSGTGNVTTPRIDLLAALQKGDKAPTIASDHASVAVNEGSTVGNTGSFGDPDGGAIKLTASAGTVSDTGGGNWAWSFGTTDGPEESQTITITATDNKGVSTSTTFALTVNNVAPSVSIDAGQTTSIVEGDALTVHASLSDPGVNDTHTATVDWGDGTSTSGSVSSTSATTGAVAGTHTYPANNTFTVTVTVTDKDGGTGQASFQLTVKNAPPVVKIDPSQATAIDEGGTLALKATFTDAGVADTHTAKVDWGTGDSSTGAVTENSGSGSVTGSHQYGDNGTYTVTVTVTDQDGGVGTASFNVTVQNVNPTAKIDLSGATPVNGVPTVIAHKGKPVAFSGRSTDPGSDDVALAWAWGDGSSGVSTSYLVNPPNPDPASSPSVQPRDVTDNKSHTFGDACTYTVGFTATDDDAGKATDSAHVVVTGNAKLSQSSTYWYLQTRSLLRTPLDLPVSTVNCYLQVAQEMSTVFSEVRDVSTMAKAHDVLLGGLSPKSQLDAQLLGAWLNFANGPFDLGTKVDSDLNLSRDSTFGAVVAHAEAVRLAPGSSVAQILRQTLVLQTMNLLGW